MHCGERGTGVPIVGRSREKGGKQIQGAIKSKQIKPRCCYYTTASYSPTALAVCVSPLSLAPGSHRHSAVSQPSVSFSTKDKGADRRGLDREEDLGVRINWTVPLDHPLEEGGSPVQTMMAKKGIKKQTFAMSLLVALAFEGKMATSFQSSRHGGRFVRQFVSRSTSLCAAKGGGKKPKNAYADTILLPQTDFSQRANAIKREPELQEYWKSTDLYSKLSSDAESRSAERFVLHDGPPYANGDLHIGHALNKLLKDFINRHQILKGKQVHYVPGWDCHGLPIELKVLQTMKSKERQGLTPIMLRERAATFAKETVEKQSASFQRYGVIGDFDNPYLTLLPEYEAAQIRVFGEMYKQGFIFRGRKPVHWSPSSRTALAEAELEYPEGHVSKSIYVALDVVSPSEELKQHADNGNLKVAIWTTTPWTIPANLAVAINPELEYCVVDAHPNVLDGQSKLLVAKGLVNSLEVGY